jgi:hypothetical protein
MADVDPVTRGSWNLDEAIWRRWQDNGLDDVVRGEWPIADRTNYQYLPFNDGMARPVPPGPYVVYEKNIPVVTMHMSSGTGRSRQNQLQRTTIQFRIHARSTSTESAKSICVRLAKDIAEAYDPDTLPWTINDDSIVNVWREPDFHTREGEDDWVWVLQYNVMTDSEYKQ